MDVRNAAQTFAASFCCRIQFIQYFETCDARPAGLYDDDIAVFALRNVATIFGEAGFNFNVLLWENVICNLRVSALASVHRSRYRGECGPAT